MLPNNRKKISFQCPCCKACEGCSDSKKTAQEIIQDVDFIMQLNISQNQLNINMEHAKITTAYDTSTLQNTKDDMSSQISAQELKNINCPRCKYNIECAKKRIRANQQNIKNALLGVCEHCQNNSIPQISCYDCEDIAEKCISSIREGTVDSAPKLKTWLVKINHLLKNSNIKERTESNFRRVPQTQPYLNKLQDTKDMFGPGSKTYKADDDENISRSKRNIKTINRTRSFDSYLHRLETVLGVKGTLKTKKRYSSKPDVIMPGSTRDYGLDKQYVPKSDNRTLVDTQHTDIYHLPDKIYVTKRHVTSPGLKDYDSLELPEKKYVAKTDFRKLLDMQDSYDAANKKIRPEPKLRARADVKEFGSNIRQHKDLALLGNNYSKQAQKINLKKYTLDIKEPVKIGKTKYPASKATKSVKIAVRDSSLLTSSLLRSRSESSLQGLEKIFLPKGVFKSVTEFYGDRKPDIDFLKSHDYLEHLISSTKSRIKTGSKTDVDISTTYYSLNKKYPSEEALSRSNVSQSKIFLGKDFSYQFPKEIISNKELKHLPTSVELIKETQDMLNLRQEAIKQKKEKERTKKLLEEQIKVQATEEKKILQEEKRKQEQTKKLKEEEEEKKKEEVRRKLEQNILKEIVKVGFRDQKKERDVDKIKTKEMTNLELTEEKTRKITEIKDKARMKRESAIDRKKAAEEKRRKEEEARINSKSDKIDKVKEKADKEAEKFKTQKEKEIPLRMQKEEKQKEREEKERLKKEKAERMRAEKAQKQREKEETVNNLKQEIAVQKSKSPKEKEKSAPELKHQKEEPSKEQPEEEKIPTVKNLKIKHDGSNAKDDALKRKREAEMEKSARHEADKKEKEIEKLGKVHGKLAKAVVKTEPVQENIKADKKIEASVIEELDIKQIKVRKPSYDDLILKLVRLKQSEPRERVKQKQLPVFDIPLVAREHQNHKYSKASKCLMCIDSEFELDVEDVLMTNEQTKKNTDIIIGQKIFTYKPLIVDNEENAIMVPSIFQSTFLVESPVITEEPGVTINEEIGNKLLSLSAKTQKLAEQEAPKGVIRYALSDRSFIEKGWTMLPLEKVVRKMNVYRMRPAHPEFDWFEHNKKKKLMLYDNGEKLADFDDTGRSRLYYKNGRLALDYYNAQEINAKQRFVVFSSGELDERGRSHPITILATFDYLGNGIVFDHGGKIRLKYNQTEGVVLDRNIGPVSHWKWHTLNDPPVLQKVMLDTQMAHKDPDIVKLGGLSNNKSRPDNEEMLAIEFDNFIKEKSEKLTQTFKPFQIKMKALKINEHFSLKILDQATIYLIFRHGTTNVKLNIGMILDHKEIVDTDTADVGEVSNNLERFPARTESLAGLQRSVAYAQRFERARVERERRLRPVEPCISADQLTAGSSRPLRPPLRTTSTTNTAANSCSCSRKPCSSNVYYDTRLI